MPLHINQRFGQADLVEEPAEVGRTQRLAGRDADVRGRMQIGQVQRDGARLGDDVAVVVQCRRVAMRMRVARVGAAAYGGQVLLSGVSARLVDGSLPAGLALRELGTFRLKGIDRAEVLAELRIDQRAHALAIVAKELGEQRPHAARGRGARSRCRRG